MTIPHPSVLPARSPADLLSVIPYLIGFTPVDSVVAIALTGPWVVFAARTDLPTSTDDELDTATSLAAVSLRQNPTSVVLVGYGPPERVVPMLDITTAAYNMVGLPVAVAFRVTDGRFFNDACTRGCCPPEGTPFDPTSNPAAAHAVFAGRVALPDRAALAAQVAPVDGADRDEMREATTRAVRRLATLLDRHRPASAQSMAQAADAPTGAAAPPPPADDRTEVLHGAGRAAISQALHRYRDDARLTDDEAAWLTVLLRHIPIRDDAWSSTDADEHHIRLWTDLTRRAQPDLVPAPASLLAFAAWRRGDGALAAVALDRALQADPTYSMALLLRQAIQAGIPPSALESWSDPA